MLVISTFFFFNDTATTEIYTLSLHDALPISNAVVTHPREVVSEGDAIKVKILRIEMERKRLGLSLKQADETDSGDHTFADDDYGHEDE